MMRVLHIAGLASAILWTGHSYAQTSLPPDPASDCVVDKAVLETWFADGSIETNGWVKPANSVEFDDSTVCDFYKWGAQMFLWLTSPENAGFVFDGAAFFDVVSVGHGEFKFVTSTPDTANNMSLRDMKSDEQIEGAGQAGGSGVLISRENSLTYYGIHANDVYAYYRTGQAGGEFKGTAIATAFPTTASDLNLIEKTMNMSFGDGVALALELKTSWVNVNAVAGDAGDYVTIKAMVPSYARTSDTLWTKGDPEEMTLALVGMHVVGSAKGHPELIWATFEHRNNAPSASYFYDKTNFYNKTNNEDDSGGSGKGPRLRTSPVEVPFDPSGDWTFFDPASGQHADKLGSVPMLAAVNSDGNIAAKNGDTIRPVNVLRLNAWGDGPYLTDQPDNASELIAINRSILGNLATGDVRKNYLQIGSIWTQKGQIPDSDTASYLRGSLKLANATMETFHQFPDIQGFVSVNCFSCHQTSSDESINVSHIFSEIEPLDVN